MKLSKAKELYGDVNLYEAIKKMEEFEGFSGKPTPKKIDMSVCIESSIDCEFSDYEHFTTITIGSRLSHITGDLYHCMGINSYEFCRPRMNHIHASPTGWDKCPLPKGFDVKYWFKSGNGYNGSDYNSDYCWSDITMFEVTGIAEGYEL